VTFDPHPAAVLQPDEPLGVLTPLPLKLHLLEDYADYCIVVPAADREVLSLSPEAFIDDFLMAIFQPAVIIEGDDFNFGAGRAGDVNTLKQLGEDRGFAVVVVPPRQIQLTGTRQNIRVSSTMIRYMLEAGHVEDAATALSRPYRLLGPVVRGYGRGRKLGFPTLNMQRPDQIIPAEGVYAGFVELADQPQQLCEQQRHLPAAFSIGEARTFADQHPLLIEAHVLREKLADMTGKWVAMDFVRRLRGQHKFSTPDELIVQIAKDCEAAGAALAGNH
jgi:riboflavin kinase/FMN adenylyltransferase